MVASPRRTVLTGIGLITPLGLSARATWEALCAGKSGVRPIQSFDASKLPVRIAGEILDFDAKQFIDKKDRKQIKVMARGIQLAVAAAQLALDDGNVDKAALDPTRFGIEFGSGLLATELKDLGQASLTSSPNAEGIVDLDKWGSEGRTQIEPLWLLKYLPNFLASHISILHNAQGPNNSITESDASGLLALGEAHRILRRGQADFMLVGGAECKVNPLSMTRNCLFNHLSHRNDSPQTACRPFDKNRDGIVLGEGAGVVLAEELEHARKRNARIYAELLGFGSAYDSRLDGRGIARAIRAALDQAGMSADEIDHVNAHGLSAIDADRAEAQGLREIFGERPVPIFAAKSYFGNLGAGSGIVEIALSLLAYETGKLPATLNYEAPDPTCLVNITLKPRAMEKPCFLKVAFNQMGQCAAVVIRHWEAGT